MRTRRNNKESLMIATAKLLSTRERVLSIKPVVLRVSANIPVTAVLKDTRGKVYKRALVPGEQSKTGN
jgi:hypothetical protein